MQLSFDLNLLQLFSSNDAIIASIVIQLSEVEKSRIKNLSHKEMKSVSTSLNKLVDNEYVELDGKVYRPTDKLLGALNALNQRDVDASAEIEIIKSSPRQINKMTNEELHASRKSFYQSQLAKNARAKYAQAYKEFIKYLFFGNDTGEPLYDVLRIRDQLTYEQYARLKIMTAEGLKRYVDVLYDHSDNKKSMFLSLKRYIVKNKEWEEQKLNQLRKNR